ncbi:alpha/beta hydrolase [Stieleria sp. TO1_6]|uniref:alpha/beta hydrolase n=1 Tax=Stieleria tagensis TaxID=2956795 RepID=UPI00209AB37A|nr:alpha/beta hydrolase [Stieleria tagensis]MCO8122765.1 alpha/beta hydrolase [Stieleria tagensis]
MRRLSVGMVFTVFAMLLALPTPVLAQTAKKRAEPLPKPRPETLRTKDGVDLTAYYFGSNKGKAAVPVLLVHEWKGQKAPYGTLCLTLQKSGCAVLALDYRGHGGSREYKDRFGKTQEFNLKTMNKGHVLDIVRYDLEEAKRFLQRENNDGKLNLNALVVIGVRDGCVPAMLWAQRDWQFPNVGTRKQGHDVKGLVMISPKRLLKGVPVESALTDPNIASLPTMIVVGEGSNEQSDADRIYKRVEVMKKKISGDKDPEGLKLLTVKEPLGGPSLVSGSPTVIPEIVKFITDEVKSDDLDNPWIERD